MISPHLYIALATARRNDLIAEARAARFAREARGNRHHRIEMGTRRYPKSSLRGRAARLAGRGPARAGGYEVTS